MAHAQKPDFVFRRNGRVHLNRQGHQFSRLLAAEVCASAVVMLDTPRSEVVWQCWLPTPFASFPFSSPPVRHRVPSVSNALYHHVRCHIHSSDKILLSVQASRITHSFAFLTTAYSVIGHGIDYPERNLPHKHILTTHKTLWSKFVQELTVARLVNKFHAF